MKPIRLISGVLTVGFWTLMSRVLGVHFFSLRLTVSISVVARIRAIIVYTLCVPGMGSPRYKDSEFSKWCKSTGSELVKLPSKPQGRVR